MRYFRLYQGKLEFIIEQEGYLFGKVYVVDGKGVLYNVSHNGSMVTREDSLSAALLACRQLFAPSKEVRDKMLEARKELVKTPTDLNMAVNHLCNAAYGSRESIHWMEHYMKRL